MRKSQISNLKQKTMIKILNSKQTALELMFVISLFVFGIYLLFGICCLLF